MVVSAAGLGARGASLAALTATLRRKYPLDLALDESVAPHALSARDGGFARAIANETMRRFGQLDDLVRAAIGFNAQRGDELSIQNVSFEQSPEEVFVKPSPVQRTLRILQPWTWLLRYAGLAVFFLLIYLLVLKPVKTQVLETLRALPESGQTALPAAEAAKFAPPPVTLAQMEGQLEQELSQTSSEVLRAVVLKRHLVDKVKKEPEGATRLVQSWVRQGNL